MPIVIAQPTAGGAFSQIAKQGDMGAYMSAFASMSNAIQSRHASDREAAGRESLGFAELSNQMSMEQSRQGIAVAEFQSRRAAELEQIQKRAEMEQWQMQQPMTLKEQQEYNQQRNSLAELGELKRKNLITQEEYDMKFHSIKGRMDFLGMKEQITKNKAMEEYRQAQTAKLKEAKEAQETLNAYNKGELAGQIDVHVPTEHVQFLSDHMAKFYPELQPGTDQYEAKRNMEASEMGIGIEVIKVPGKPPVSVASLQGKTGTAGAGGTQGTGGASGQPREMTFKDAYTAAESALKDPVTGKVAAHEEVVKRAEQILQAEGQVRQRQQGEKTGEAGFSRAMAGLDTMLSQVHENQNLGEGAKVFIMDKIREIKDLSRQFPPGGKRKMPKAVEERIRRLKAQVDSYQGAQSAPAAGSVTYGGQ